MLLLNVIISIFIFVIISFVLSIKIFALNVDKRKCFRLSIISLCVFYGLSVIAYAEYSLYGSFFQYPDQEYFFSVSEMLGTYSSIKEIFYTSFYFYKFADFKGAAFCMGLLSYLANNFFGGNSVFIQISSIALCTALIPIFVFRTLRYFVSTYEAYRGALLYMFLSPILYYSVWLLRDMQVALLYSICIAVLFSPFSKKKLLFLVLMCFVIALFRFENGLFSAAFPALFFYNNLKKNKLITVSFFVLLVVIVAAVYASELFKVYSGLQSNIAYYIEFTNNSVESAGGLSQTLYKLPIGVRQIAISVYSQMSPFPPWELVVEAKTPLQFFFGILRIIYPLFWFVVWFIIVKSLLINRELRRGIPLFLYYVGLVFIVFLLANTHNINVRRLLCMYPVVYIFYIYIKSKYPQKMGKYTFQAISTYLVLVFCYLLMKFL